MYFKSQAFGGSSFVLAFPDNSDTISVKLDKDDALAVVVDGRKVVRQGSVYYKDNRAIGIVFNDVDVTDGGDNVAIIVKGTVLFNKLPDMPDATEMAQMKDIIFINDEDADYSEWFNVKSPLALKKFVAEYKGAAYTPAYVDSSLLGNDDTAKYSTDGTTWGTTPPTVTSAGEVTVKVKIERSGVDDPVGAWDCVTEITKKPLEVTADSDTKVHDGSALTKSTITSKGLVAGHSVTATVTGTQTDVGSSANVPSVAVVKDASNATVTTNYDITYVNGVLTVTAVPAP